jgi:tetratricopeptide (TPR) repeat protein
VGGWACLLLVLSASACQGRGPLPTVPRTLEGQTRTSSFVPPFAYEAYVRGELALAKGAFDEAAAQLELATAAPEEDPFLLSRLAYAQARAGQPREAEQSLEHALKLDPCSEAVFLTRGELSEQAGDLERAKQAYARASECAPQSTRGPLAHARVLERAGQPSEAVEVLSRFAGAQAGGETGTGGREPGAALAQVAFEAALKGRDPVVLAHALESWIAYEAPDTRSLQRAAAWALSQGVPNLAQRVIEHHRGPVPKALHVEIARALGEREQLRLLLPQALAEDLGGAQHTAELALYAGDLARAELEATSALASAPSDALHALRARARFGQGDWQPAVDDLRAIGDLRARRAAVLAVLEDSGNPALARELRAAAERTQ